MNRIVKNTILSLAVAATTLSAMPLANAGQRQYGQRWEQGQRWEHGPRRHDYRRHHDSGDAIVAGVIGLAIGALIVGAASQPRYVEPIDDGYFPEPPRRAVRYGGGLEPWSRDWYRYCADRYRTFDPRTGTYMSYEGVRNFCEAN